MKIRYSIFLLLALFSCGKFEHHEPDLNPSCEMCAWADSLEGLYSGTMIHENYVNGSSSIWTDSLYVQVEHTFVNQNPYHDSTVMYFRLTEYSDSMTNPNPPKVRLVAAESMITFKNDHYEGVNLNDSSIYLRYHEAGYDAWVGISYNLTSEGTLYR